MSRNPDTRQLTLDAMFLAPAPEPSKAAGGLDVAREIREHIETALDHAKRSSGGHLDRYAIAAEMSRSSGREITKNMLDRWTAQSADAWRFPLEALPSFIQATGDFGLFDFVAERLGCRVLRGENAWIAEVGALIAARQEINQRLAKYKDVLPNGMADELMARAQKRSGGL
jgi:hypothetical protein